MQPMADCESLEALLQAASRMAAGQRLWVALDVGLGVPAPYWKALLQHTGAAYATFVDWLLDGPDPAERISDPAEAWQLDRPFFRVPKGRGALTRIMARTPGILREVDRATGGKSVFILSGVPGAVGQASRLIWSEIHGLRRTGHPLRVWPFESARGQGPVLVEMYPRLFYPGGRLSGPKGDPAVRAAALQVLQPDCAPADLQWAEDSEDAFDALVGLCGVVSKAPSRPSMQWDPVAEGGMWGWGPVRRR